MKTFLFILALSGSALCFGQLSLSGKVTDRDQILPHVMVMLHDLDSVMLKGAITDSTGKFLFEYVRPGSYLISASLVGYSRFFSQSISVENKDITLPEIVLEEAPTTLGEVTIKAGKPLFDQKIDRLVINVESSITSSGNTILEVLQKSPGIVVNRQNNSITMNGKSGVRVMINGKLMQVPLDVAVQMLDGMTASNVEKIELITTPPAKYDADGSAGIIHIVTKASVDLGTNGSVGLTLGARWRETLGGNFNINHRNKDLAYFLDYAIVRNHNLHIFEMDRQSLNSGFAQTVNNYSHRENITTQQNLSAGFEWKLSKKTLMNCLLTGYRRNWNLSAYTHDIHHVEIDSTVTTGMNINESNIWQSATGSIGLQSAINTKGVIRVDLDYLYYHNNNPSYYVNELFHEQHNLNEVTEIDLKKTTPIRFFIGKADYQYDVSSSFRWEAGVKAVTSTLNNNVLVQRNVNDVWTTNPVFTSYSNLKEQVVAGYASIRWYTLRQWQINSGLRYEYTHTSIGKPTQQGLINRKYGYLFPDFSLRKNLDTERDFQFSYSRRITRPTYNDIAPYVFFWGPNTFSAGNTSLYPAITDAVTAGYHVKQWIISLQFSHSRNEIISLQPETDSQTNNLTYRSQNLKYLNTLGLTNAWSNTITSWWEIQSNLSVRYQIAQTSHLTDNTTLYLYGFNINLVNILRLPRDFSIEISGIYQSKLLSGISQFLPLGSLNAGIQKSLREKGTLKLSVDDILRTNNWRIKTYSTENNLISYFNYDWHNQFIRLTYTRNFGNNKLRSVKLRSGSEEERRRISD